MDDLRVRASFGVATMISADQVERLGYDSLGVVGDAQFGYALLPWLQAHVGGGVATFPSDAIAGGLATVTAGGGANTTGEDIRLYAHLDGGVGFTGRLTRPFMRTAGGVDFRLSEAFTLGPVIGYDQVFQHNTATSSADARFLWAGMAVTFRPAALKSRPVPPRPPPPLSAPPPKPRIEVRIERAPPTVVTEPSEELLELIDQTLPRTKVEVQLLAPVLFRFNSDKLDPTGVAMLHEVARELSARQELELIEIQGYADERGSAEYNTELSHRRAQRVFDWLVEHGVQATRLRVAARGENAPVERGAEEAKHEQNRRVVFRVIRVNEEAQRRREQTEMQTP